MAAKKLLTVELTLASDQAEYCRFQSKTSLLDWDIVLFRPDIHTMTSATDDYQGKPSLSDSSSFHLKECCEHWRREIKQAFDTGKTVIIFLAPLEEVYVDTGQRSYSGTGRNQRTTRHVAPYSNYESIPASLGQVSATGSSMKLVARGAEILAPYWEQFGDRSHYQVILTSGKVPACVVTKTGDRPVGAIFRNKSSSGTILLLPDIDFRPEGFTKSSKDGMTWTPTAIQFAAQIVSAIVAMDRALRAGAEVTPEPSWATDVRYALPNESTLRTELLDAETQLETAQKRKEGIAETLRAAGSHRALLFEKGKPLEFAVIEALRLLGFSAKPYRESDSEFDVVFESEEGRLIGEAEGKDTNPVNIDKLRQLAMNIHEDLQREDVDTPAKGVLFGNGFRLQLLQDRPDPFSKKCQSAAATTGTALVFTPDLFVPVQYLLAVTDEGYRRACREVILASVGRVTFPRPPTSLPSPRTDVQAS